MPHIQEFSRTLDQLLLEDSTLLNLLSQGDITEDVFKDHVKTDDPTFLAVNAFPADRKLLVDCLKTIMKAIGKVRDNQLSTYITGEFSKVTEQLLKDTSASEPHNIFAERALGMMDYHIRHSKQASVDFLGARISAITNKTIPWLHSLPEPELTAIVSFAVKMGAVFRKERQARRKDLKASLIQRQIERGQKRDGTLRRQFQNVIKEAIK